MAQKLLAMIKMADKKIESVVKRQTSSIMMLARKVLTITAMTMHNVVEAGKAESDLGQNHLTTESLWAEMETLILAQKAHLSASCARCDVSILTVHPVQVHLAHSETRNRKYLLHLMMIQNLSLGLKQI